MGLICFVLFLHHILVEEIILLKLTTSTTSTEGGDYSTSHDQCSLQLTCKAPEGKNLRIKSDSCSFT